MIVAILLAYLTKRGLGNLRREVWFGVATALLFSALGGFLAYLLVRSYDGSAVQAVLEGATYVVAAVVLTFMTLWMKRESRELRAKLTLEVDRIAESGTKGALGLLAFVTVLREGLETTVFTLALVLSAPRGGVLLGAALGLAAALALAHLLYRAGLRLNLSLFFNVVGSFLMLSAAGLLADAIEDFQSLGWISFWRTPLWSTGRVLPESGFLGDILHSFLGYAQSPTLLQVVLYGLYLGVLLVLLWREGTPPVGHGAARAKSA